MSILFQVPASRPPHQHQQQQQEPSSSNGRNSKQSNRLTIPPSAAVRHFSKQLLLTSELANRFLFAVNETETAKQRIKQRKTSAFPKPVEEVDVKSGFAVVGSEIVSPTKKVMNAQQNANNLLSPACSMVSVANVHPPSLSGSQEALNYSPMLLRRDRTSAELISNAGSDASFLPQIHPAAFYPRFYPKQRLGTAGASTKNYAKPCAFCPVRHSNDHFHAHNAPPSAQIQLSSSKISATMQPNCGGGGSNFVSSTSPTQQQQQIPRTQNSHQRPEMIEHARTLPNIILHFNIGIQPTVVPPPLTAKVKPWNLPPRTPFIPVSSPNNSRISTAISLKSAAMTLERRAPTSTSVIQPTQKTNNNADAENDSNDEAPSIVPDKQTELVVTVIKIIKN